MAVTPNEVTDEGVAEGNTWPTEDDDVASWVEDRKTKAEQRLSDWYDAARKDFGFYENRQWEETDIAKMESEKRVAVTFNRVAPIINSVCGQEVANRQEVKFLPRRVGEVSAADPMNDAVKWIRDNCNAEDEDSDAFRDMTICGMGWTVARMDYEENPDGEGRVERRDPLLVRWDPAARRKNLADKKWVQSDYWMTKDAIRERWPDADVSGLANLTNPEHQSPHDSTESWKYKNDALGQDVYNDQWRVVHHVERFTKKAHRVIDPQSGQIKTLSAEDFTKATSAAKEIGFELQSVPTQQRVYWEAWTVGKVVLQSGQAQVQKDFQYQAMTCFRERETGYWFGLVRLMLDPQRYANRMASLLMSILSTGAKGGFLYETGAFVNPRKAKADWARTDSAIELTTGALTAGRVKAKDPVQMPQGASELMQFAITSIRDVTGANVEMLGMRQEDQPGIVEDMRTKAGLTILAPVFDAMRLYRKRQGLILAEFVSRFLSDGRLIRVWGQMGQQFVPLVRPPDVVEYDLVIDESPASRDVKERTWMVVGQMMPLFQALGMPPPPEVLDYAPIPEALSMSIKKQIMQQRQQPPPPNPEVMKAQAQAQAQTQIAQVKAGAQAQAEQARVAADVQIEHDKAQVQMQLEQMKNAQATHFAQQEAQMKMNATILQAIITQIGKVEAARVTAKADDGSEFVSEKAYPQ